MCDKKKGEASNKIISIQYYQYYQYHKKYNATSQAKPFIKHIKLPLSPLFLEQEKGISHFITSSCRDMKMEMVKVMASDSSSHC